MNEIKSGKSEKLSVNTIMNWKMPEELSVFNMLITPADDDHHEHQLAMVEKMLLDSSNIPHYINLLLEHLAEDESMEAAIAENIKQLQGRRNRYNRRIETIKSYLQMIMDRYGLKKFDCPNGTISKVIKQNSRLQINDEGDILINNPEYFVRPDPELDKQKLKADLLDGKSVSGADLVHTEYIQVRR